MSISEVEVAVTLRGGKNRQVNRVYEYPYLARGAQSGGDHDNEGKKSCVAGMSHRWSGERSLLSALNT